MYKQQHPYQRRPPTNRNPYDGGGYGGGGNPNFNGIPNRGRQNDAAQGPTRSQLWMVLASLLGMSVWYLTPVSDLLVGIMLEQVPLEADKALGRRALEELPYVTVHHPNYTPLVQSIGWTLVDSSPNKYRHYDWDFAIIQDSALVNAFALPGGIIRVSTGLLDQLDLTSGEVAALIGHEMGHVVHRHSQARILQQKVVGYMLNALIYKDDDPQQESFGEAVGELLLSSADWLGRQAFSRKDEYEADATSWDLLAESRSYNPQALKSLLSKLWELTRRAAQQQQRSGTLQRIVDGKTSWESTHPGSLDRIDALEKKWNALSGHDRRRLARGAS